MYKLFIKPFLFNVDPEKAHYLTMRLLKLLYFIPGFRFLFSKYYTVNNKKLEKNIAGMLFKNPVGLAAGFDKDGKFIKDLIPLGFGFIEIGTVTPQPQAGNDKPRLFRLPQDEALINRMGFNNEGLDAMVERLKALKTKGVIIGGNIGKNKVTPNERATDDYIKGFVALKPYVDYFAVNISSPNTPGLRELQDKEPLTFLLSELQKLNHKDSNPKPVFLKIAPDLTESQLDDIIDIASDTRLTGLITTNTTISRAALSTPAEKLEAIGAGGVSGKPLFDHATSIVRYIRQKSGNKFIIIASGGVYDENAALEKLKAGADLVQIYTGMIYQGPAFVRNINKIVLEKYPQFSSK